MSKKLGNKMPPSEARPLGTKAPKRSSGSKSSKVKSAPVPTAVVVTDEPSEGLDAVTSAVSVDTAENNSENVEKVLDAPPSPVVNSDQSAITPNVTNNTRNRTMQLTLDKISKSGTTAIYKGAAVAIRIGLSAFTNKTAPATLDLNGELAGPKQAKVPETKEERKARLAALPKLTTAERVAKLEEKLAKLREKAAAAPAAEPVAEPATASV